MTEQWRVGEVGGLEVTIQARDDREFVRVESVHNDSVENLDPHEARALAALLVAAATEIERVQEPRRRESVRGPT